MGESVLYRQWEPRWPTRLSGKTKIRINKPSWILWRLGVMSTPMYITIMLNSRCMQEIKFSKSIRCNCYNKLSSFSPSTRLISTRSSPCSRSSQRRSTILKCEQIQMHRFRLKNSSWVPSVNQLWAIGVGLKSLPMMASEDWSIRLR